jgi:alkylation response protein AidB-like acyl-CoA dehydrogenase
MFIPALNKLCTDEQKRQWIPQAKAFKIIGTYAQTELGHGLCFLWGKVFVGTQFKH